jgi:hypothetical protein
MSRGCAACGAHLPRHEYSSNQWRKGVGFARCSNCVGGGGGGGGGGGAGMPDTLRRNDAADASFTQYDLSHPFAEGAFRWVAKGHYTSGRREGEKCVCKWFKTGGTFESSFFDVDIKAVDRSAAIIKEWNNQKIIDKHVQMNKPEVWTFTPGSGDSWAGRKVLQEPFIENWQKFNSNSGWADGSGGWADVMQALSHFSYHASGGQFLLCDLQGGLYSHGAVLTDPVILSRDHSYGVTDLGPQGISSFFARHQCGEFCRAHWNMPKDRTAYHHAQQGTSMAHAPTNHHKPPMTGMFGFGGGGAIAEESSDDDDY